MSDKKLVMPKDYFRIDNDDLKNVEDSFKEKTDFVVLDMDDSGAFRFNSNIEKMKETVQEIDKRVSELSNMVNKIDFEIMELNKKFVNNNMAIAARIGELERRIHD